MTEIYLIRHTQAEGNRYRIMQGHWDGGVTATGLKQIELLAERFRDLPVDAVYSSDLYRARLTATAITRWGGQELQIDTRLREINVGPWETRFFGNVFHDEPERAYRFIRDPESFSLEGAETYAQVRTRACEALEAIARTNPGRRVAVVSHGVTIRCALSGITGIDLRDVERLPICKNTAVTHLLWDGERFHLDYYNDASHLAPLGEAPWSRNGDVRHERFDPASDPDFYKDCYAGSTTAGTRTACCACWWRIAASACWTWTPPAAPTRATAGSALCISSRNTAARATASNCWAGPTSTIRPWGGRAYG